MDEFWSMDWHEVNFYLDQIGREQRESRRWGLMSQLAGSLAGGATTPEAAASAFEYWHGLMAAATSEQEKLEQAEAEEAEQWRLLEEQRRERQAEARAAGKKSSIQSM